MTYYGKTLLRNLYYSCKVYYYIKKHNNYNYILLRSPGIFHRLFYNIENNIIIKFIYINVRVSHLYIVTTAHILCI